MNRRNAHAILLASSLSLLPTLRSTGALTTWLNSTNDGMWATAGNWKNSVPTSVDTAYLSAAGTIQLPVGTTVFARSVESAFGGSGSVTLQGGQLTTPNLTWPPSRGLTINSTLTAPGAGMLLQGNGLTFQVTGTIGDGFGGGTFDSVLSTIALKGPITSSGDVFFANSTSSLNGSMAVAKNVTFWGTATMTVDSSNLLLDRLPNQGTTRLAGTLRFVATSLSNVGVREDAGTLTPVNGVREIILPSPTGSGSLVLAFNNINREAGDGILLTRGDSSRLVVANPPTGSDGAATTDRAIIAWGHSNATPTYQFLTYDRGSNANDPSDDVGLRPLVAGTETVGIVSPAGGNVLLTSDQSISADASIRSLNMNRSKLTLDGARLTIQSGGVMFPEGTANSSIGGTGTLEFGDEAIITSIFTGGSAIHAAIRANKLTKVGGGNISIANAAAVTGPIYLSGGTLTSLSAHALNTKHVVINRGWLRAENESITINDLELASGFYFNFGSPTGFGSGTGSLSPADGVTITVLHASGGSNLSASGEGLVYFPNGAPDLAAELFCRSGELRLDGKVGDFISGEGGTVSGRNLDTQNLLIRDTASVVLSPGPGTAQMWADTIALTNSSSSAATTTLKLDFGGLAPGIEYDQLCARTALSINGILSFDISLNYSPTFGDTFTIINCAAGIRRTISQANPEGEIVLSQGNQYRLSYLGGDGNDVTLTYVPEPAAFSAAALSCLLVSRHVVRRKPVTQLMA